MSVPSRSRSRIAAAAAAVLAASLLLTSCAAAAASSKSSEPVDGGTLKISFAQDNTTLVSLDPFQVYWLEHRVVLRNVAESLTDQDPDTGEIIPWLAKDWTISNDALEYTFHLRSDVTFSNGEKFDAEAVKTAFDSDKAFAAANPATFGGSYLRGYDHTEIIDPYTVKIVLSAANAAFLQATSTTNLAILAPASYKLSPAERSLGKIIGTGPFTLEKYTPEVGITLKKRTGYAWPSKAAKNRGEAHVDKVEITYTPEDSVRNGNFQQGVIDISWPRNPFTETDLALLKSSGGTIQSRSLPGPAFNLYPNVSNGHILSDPLVRQALQKSIDRKSYASTIYNKDFDVVQSVFDSTTPYFASQSALLKYDPKGAAALLDKAGWKVGTDGYRYKDGAKLTLVLPIQLQTPGFVLVQDQLKKVGIDLQLKVLVPGELAAATASGDFDLLGTYLTRADPTVLQSLIDPRFTNNSFLAVNSSTPEVEAELEQLYDEGRSAIDPKVRAAVYTKLQEKLLKENVAFPVYERLWQAATSTKVHGFRWTSEGFALLNDIWLDS
ncbi:MAG TPA: ABC transporter substrate-binding protein [Pseudolysinimonas sp.]|nr:ABC transporter substrate-binding protein [Pseudolysinimonas sp.]